MRARSSIRAAEFVTLGAAIVLMVTSLLPTVSEGERNGLRLSAGLFTAFAVAWFHLVGPIPQQQRNIIGSAIVQVLATVMLLETGGITSRYFIYFLLPIFGTTIFYQLSAWLAVAIVAVGAFFVVWASTAATGPRELVNEMAITEFMALIATLFLSGVVSRVVARVHEQLAAQSAALKMELTHHEDYLAMVAHELRNPLVAIRAASRVLAMGKGEGERVTQTATGIVSEASTGLDLLDSLTDLQSIEAGRMRSMLAPTDLATLARSATDAIRESTGREILCLGADHPVMVLGDDRRLAQVLSNLLRNAAKYTPADTSIEATIGSAPDRKRAIVVIRDHGPGVPPAERARLFGKFARLSTAGGTRGSGLGLYICREIIRDHNGELSADWPAGGGSEFAFTVPLVAPAAAAPPRG